MCDIVFSRVRLIALNTLLKHNGQIQRTYAKKVDCVKFQYSEPTDSLLRSCGLSTIRIWGNC
jgi:hypothetical protein